MISVRNLTKRFGEVLAVDDIAFEVAAGEVMGFLGPNGAGKTTTLRILAGYLPATSGTVRVADLDVLTQSLRVRQQIGYLPENVPLYPEMRVHEYLHFRGRLKGCGRREISSARQECWLPVRVMPPRQMSISHCRHPAATRSRWRPGSGARRSGDRR